MVGSGPTDRMQCGGTCCSWADAFNTYEYRGQVFPFSFTWNCVRNLTASSRIFAPTNAHNIVQCSPLPAAPVAFCPSSAVFFYSALFAAAPYAISGHNNDNVENWKQQRKIVYMKHFGCTCGYYFMRRIGRSKYKLPLLLATPISLLFTVHFSCMVYAPTTTTMTHLPCRHGVIHGQGEREREMARQCHNLMFSSTAFMVKKKFSISVMFAIRNDSNAHANNSDYDVGKIPVGSTPILETEDTPLRASNPSNKKFILTAIDNAMMISWGCTPTIQRWPFGTALTYLRRHYYFFCFFFLFSVSSYVCLCCA